MATQGKPSDDVSSAPESGTVREETCCGNNPSKGGIPVRQFGEDDRGNPARPPDDESSAPESGTVRGYGETGKDRRR